MIGEPKQEEISLYVHVPFCQKKCDYCHFFVLPHRTDLVADFTSSLSLEWEQRRPFLDGKKLVSVYFGGGTPSLWGPEPLSHFLDKVLSNFPGANPEITLEVNPETVNEPLMRAYRAAGINRVSMGVQSLDDSLLQLLTRTHSARQAEDAVHLLHHVGFPSISIDLMYDLPQQTETHWETTVQRAKELPIHHLSLYNLTFEPGTVFFKKKTALEKALPSPEKSAWMFQHVRDVFSTAPWSQYEISAFSLPDHFSRHNTGYWTGRPFFGLGPSAFSFWEGKRFRNVPHLGRYKKAVEDGVFPIDFEERLSAEASLRERLVVRLRLLQGLDLKVFEGMWGALDDETRESLMSLAEQGLLERNGSYLRLTDQGVLFYDTLASELI